MTRFIEGCNRRQRLLLPDCVDDYVGEDSPVRVVDAFIDELDLDELGFAGPATTGRPGYHPATLLKLYLYGYLNQVQSSRRLEREAGRNVECMWLTGKLAPDFKTIADFRRDNGEALRAVCRQFIILCRELGLIAGGTVAVDGSRFKAVNTRDRNYTPGAVRRRIEQVDASIQRYLQMLDTADRQEGKEVELRTALVGYNVQAAVDTAYHIVVAHEVTNVGHDRQQLANMARQAKAATGVDELTVLADRGYFSGEEILACEGEGVTPICPKPLTSSAKADGRWGKQDFRYEADTDTYRCPAGEQLTRRFSSVENGLTMQVYWADACAACQVKGQCTTGKERRIRRWEHEHVVDAMQARLDRMPEAMRVRRRTVEHVFGTLKDWMGRSHFKTRTLDRVGTEMSLHVLAYNFKRAVAVLGTRQVITAIKA